MEIPFHTIVNTEFVNATPGSGLASFYLSRAPFFYLEDIVTPPTGGPPVRTWKRCADWTEGMQATKILRHDLVGSAVQLANLLRNLQAAPSSDVVLHGLQYLRSELPSGHSVDHSSVPLPPSLPGQPHGYRPPFGGSAVDTGREDLVTEVPKRYSFPGAHSVSAPTDATTYGDPLGTSPHPHSHLGLTNSSSPSPGNPYSSYPPLSAAPSSSSYSNMSLFPIAAPIQRSHSHLGNYAHVSATAQSPYIGQSQTYHPIPAQPASAPPSHSHFELAPTPPPPSLTPQQYHRHQTTQMLGPPSVPVPLPFGNGFDTSGHRGSE
jgi:hypothetical protein